MKNMRKKNTSGAEGCYENKYAGTYLPSGDGPGGYYNKAVKSGSGGGQLPAHHSIAVR